MEELSHTYGSMLSWGKDAFRNYILFRYPLLRPLFLLLWNRIKKMPTEGLNLFDAQKIKQNVRIPVLCTGGFQRASFIRKVIGDGMCDAVTITRSLIANPDLVKVFEQGRDMPERPCTYCDKCLVNILEYPIGCYELSRYEGDFDSMIKEVMSVFQPSDF